VANGPQGDEPLARRASRSDFEELLAILELDRVADDHFVGRHPSKNPVRLLPKEGGWTPAELFDQINKTTGISILFDSQNATFKQQKIEFVGVHVIEEDQLFDWLQAVLSYRKLVLVPRETPLSSIHLRGLATLNEAGAVVLFAAPGFYHGAESIDDLVDFVVARCLDQIGIDNTLVARWGDR